jgi:protein-tyrosine-phosphatase
MAGPLFVCHANCCRSVLACYLYRHLWHSPACSAGLDPGDVINDRAERLLRAWGIDASGHRPARVTRDACVAADAIFVMGPSYLHRLLSEYGEDLATRSYLFADPFSKPSSFDNRAYIVWDPSFDDRPTNELLNAVSWMHDRVRQIRGALIGHGPPLIPVSEYLDLCKTVDPTSH